MPLNGGEIERLKESRSHIDLLEMRLTRRGHAEDVYSSSGFIRQDAEKSERFELLLTKAEGGLEVDGSFLGNLLPEQFTLRDLMSVLEYIEETDPPEVRELLTAAHHFLRETLPPFAACAIKWRIPFYSLRRNFCYLNRHRDHITLGFPHGYKLAPRPGVLLGESEKLKHVRYLKIRSVEDLYSEETLRILHEAIMLDEMMAKVNPKFRGS